MILTILTMNPQPQRHVTSNFYHFNNLMHVLDKVIVVYDMPFIHISSRLISSHWYKTKYNQTIHTPPTTLHIHQSLHTTSQTLNLILGRQVGKSSKL